MHCTPHNPNKSEGVADPFGQQLRWLRGVDLNHRPLGYEPKKIRNFNNLQDAGGSQNPCKERSVSIIGQLMDRRAF